MRNLDEGRLEKGGGASDGSDGVQCAKSQCLNCPRSWNYTCTSTACWAWAPALAGGWRALSALYPQHRVRTRSRQSCAASRRTHRPSRGMHRVSRGIDRRSRGLHRPSHGIDRRSHGMDRPSRGLHRPSHDLHRPSRGLHRPSRGLHRPSRGLHRPSHGLHRPSRGIDRPRAGMAGVRNSGRTARFPDAGLDGEKPYGTEISGHFRSGAGGAFPGTGRAPARAGEEPSSEPSSEPSRVLPARE